MPEDDETQTEEQTDPTETNALRSAREAADRNATKAKRTDTLEVENAGLRGLGAELADSPLGKMFLSSYDGDANPEAIKTKALEVGLLQPQAAPETTEQTPEQIQAEAMAKERAALQTGTLPPLTPEQREKAAEDQRSPQERGLDQFFAETRAGQPREKAAAAFFGTMIDAAVHGDDRALWTPTEEVRNAVGI